MMEVKISWKGLQKAQRWAAKSIKAMEPQNAPQAATRMMLLDAYRYVLMFIHVDTGTLKLAQRMRMASSTVGEISTLPGAVNPKTGLRAVEYVGTEFGRGGFHDTYALVTRNYSEQIVEKGFLHFAYHVWRFT